MYNDLFNKFIICVLFAVFLANCGYGNNSISDVNDFFVVGDYRVVEVATSKLSHVSGRSFPFVAPLPKGQSGDDFRRHYNRQYMCISIEDKLKLKKGIRVVFRLDLIDTNGQSDPNFQSLNVDDDLHKTLYYAYLDVKPKGSGVSGAKYPIHKKPNFKSKDELRPGFLAKSYRSGIEFPMMFTFPPAMNQYENFKENSWINSGKTYDLKTKELVDVKGKAIVYTEAVKLKFPNYMRIKASLVNNANRTQWEIKEKDKIYYSEKEKVLGKVKKQDSIEVYKIRDETQIWDKADDWLWLEMERIDGKGNVIMRCKKLKISKEKIKVK